MSYLYYLIFGESEEEEVKDDLKNRQKHLKYLCCKSIEQKNTPVLRSKLSSFINEPFAKSKSKQKGRNKKSNYQFY
jgi:ribosome-binding factor A